MSDRAEHASSIEPPVDRADWQLLFADQLRLGSVEDASVDTVLALAHLCEAPAGDLFDHAARIVRRSGHVIASVSASSGHDAEQSTSSIQPLRMVRSLQRLGLDVVQLDVLAPHGRGRAAIRQGVASLRMLSDRPRTTTEPITLLVHAIRTR